MYISSSLNYTLKPDLSLNVEHVEDIWVEIYPEYSSKPIIVGGVYFHPHSSHKAFQDKIEQLMEKINATKQTFYVLGDFNINYLSNLQTVVDYKHSLESLGVINLITCPTRFMVNQTPSLLDHIYCNKPSAGINSGTIAYDISDHNIVFTYSQANNLKINHKPHLPSVFKRNFSNFNEENFLLMLESELLKLQKYCSPVLDIQIKFSNFVDSFVKCLDVHAPMQKLSRKQTKFYFKPWLTKDIQKHIKIKNDLYKISSKHSHSETYYNKYKEYNKFLNKLKDQSKQNYYKSKFDKHQRDIKHTWKTINSIIRKQKPSSTVQSVASPLENVLITNPKGIANCFNDYFSTVGANLSSAIKPIKTKSSPLICTSQNCSSIFLNPVCSKDVIKEIELLDNNKCDDTYDISVYILKLSRHLIASILSNLFNQCLEIGVYPTVLKMAKVIPVHKNGDKFSASNYRPISILPHFSKIFEKLLQMDLVKFLTKNNIISACQYGFQENKSTNDALADLCNHLQNQKAINKTTCGIFIDLKKAFDTVDHAILKKKLYHYGIRGVPFNLFSDYLSNRHQFVYVNTVKSDSTLISTGVPQGSVLGPVLFLIYINDLPKATNLKTLLFADDTALFASEKNPALLKQIIATEINNIEKWLSINKLTLNLKKSCYVMFSKNKKTDIKNMVSVGGICLAQKAFTKYLGIQIDSLLNWKPHIETLTSSISKSVGILYKLKDYTSKSILKMVYQALIKSKLQCGIVLWGNSNKSTLDRLNKLHNRALRCITGLPFRTSIVKLYKNAAVLQINELYKFEMLKYMNKLHTTLRITNHSEGNVSLVNSVHKYNTRQAHNKNFFVSNVLTSNCSNGLFVNGSKFWNQLPQTIKNEMRLRQFNKLVLDYLLQINN